MIGKNNLGFTLVEVIFALGIFATVAVLGTGVFLSVVKSQRQTYATQSAAQELRFFQDTVSRDVREAGKVVCTGSSLTISDVDDGNKKIYSWNASDPEPRKIYRDSNNINAPVINSNVEQFSISCPLLDSGATSFVTVYVKVAKVADPYQVTVMTRGVQ